MYRYATVRCQQAISLQKKENTLCFPKYTQWNIINGVLMNRDLLNLKLICVMCERYFVRVNRISEVFRHRVRLFIYILDSFLQWIHRLYWLRYAISDLFSRNLTARVIVYSLGTSRTRLFQISKYVIIGETYIHVKVLTMIIFNLAMGMATSSNLW